MEQQIIITDRQTIRIIKKNSQCHTNFLFNFPTIFFKLYCTNMELKGLKVELEEVKVTNLPYRPNLYTLGT